VQRLSPEHPPLAQSFSQFTDTVTRLALLVPADYLDQPAKQNPAFIPLSAGGERFLTHHAKGGLLVTAEECEGAVPPRPPPLRVSCCCYSGHRLQDLQDCARFPQVRVVLASAGVL
jgi:hypothetical protein